MLVRCTSTTVKGAAEVLRATVTSRTDGFSCLTRSIPKNERREREFSARATPRNLEFSGSVVINQVESLTATQYEMTHI